MLCLPQYHPLLVPLLPLWTFLLQSSTWTNCPSLRRSLNAFLFHSHSLLTLSSLPGYLSPALPLSPSLSHFMPIYQFPKLLKKYLLFNSGHFPTNVHKQLTFITSEIEHLTFPRLKPGLPHTLNMLTGGATFHLIS